MTEPYDASDCAAREHRARRRAHWTAPAILLALVAISPSAMAQSTSPGPPPATVQPPSLQQDSPATYPAQAIQAKHFPTIEITLVLEVDAAGAVVAAVPEPVDQPDADGFAEAAREAALRLVFAPATRNGVAIASRIKFKYRFVPPAPVLVGRLARADSDAPIAGATVEITGSDGTPRTVVTDAAGGFRATDLPEGAVRIRAAPPGLDPVETVETLAYAEETRLILRAAPPAPPVAPIATDEQPEEVSVRGIKPPREVVKRSLTAQEMAQIPGTNGDALRSVQSLPGVARPPPFSGDLFVRGSESDDTTVYVDGTPIPLIYHFGGLSSVLPTESLEKLDFYPGNFSSIYGRGMGGVVDVGLRAPKVDRFHGMAQLDMVDARLLAEGPLGHGWSFLAAGRRSWFDVWLGPLLNAADSGIKALPRYYDYQLTLHKAWSANHTLRVTLFGADDAFKAVISGGGDAEAIGSLGIATKFARLQAVYRNQLTEKLELSATAAIGTDIVDLTIGVNALKTTSYPLSLRTELSYRWSSAVRVNAGIDLLEAPYDLLMRLPPSAANEDMFTPGEQSITSQSSGSRFLGGAYTELEITPWRGGRVVPGLRADYTSTTSRTDVSPRLNMRQEIFSGPRALALKGAIGLFYQPPSLLESDPALGQRGLKSKRSVHYDLGVDYQLTPELKLSLDGFYKTMDRLVIARRGNSGEGRSYGAELLLRYTDGDRRFGWLSYTASRSDRRDASGEPWQKFASDQTHVLTALASQQLGRGWRVGGRFRLVSGNLYTPTIEGAFDSTTGAYLTAESTATYSMRLPLFQQLDLRVDKTWTFPSWKLTGYLDVQNVYNYRAVEGVTYNYDYTSSAYEKGLTIFPSVGVRVEL